MAKFNLLVNRLEAGVRHLLPSLATEANHSPLSVKQHRQNCQTSCEQVYKLTRNFKCLKSGTIIAFLFYASGRFHLP